MHEELSILIPGGLRLRAVRPVVDREGACPFLYDLERSCLIAVPEEFLHVAEALERGDLDEALLGWLAGEDLLTWQGPPAGRGLGRDAWAAGDDGASGSGLVPGQVLFAGGEIHCCLPLGRREEALATLEAVLRRADGVTRLVLRLDAEAPLRRFDLVREIVATVDRSLPGAAETVHYEVTVALAAVSAAEVRLLADRSFHVTVDMGLAPRSEDAPLPAGLQSLQQALGERLTVRVHLGAGAGLADLWRWARLHGLARLDVVRIVREPAASAAEEARRYRGDLFEICDGIEADLELGRPPMVLEPLIRVVRRLAAGLPADGPSEGGCLGFVLHGDVLPFCSGSSAEPHGVDRAEGEWHSPEPADDDGTPAQGGGPEVADAFRIAEIEVAILLFGRVRDSHLADLLGGDADRPALLLAQSLGGAFDRSLPTF